MTDTPKKVAARAQDDVRQAVNRLSDVAWLRARPYDVRYTDGEPIIVSHGFGRPAAGWLVSYVDQPIGQLYEKIDSGFDRTKQLVLLPSMDGMASRTINLTLLVW